MEMKNEPVQMFQVGSVKLRNLVTLHVGMVVRIRKHSFKVVSFNLKTHEFTLQSCSYKGESNEY